MNLEERSSLVNTPMLHLAGWFDIFSESQIKAFVELQFNGGPYARKPKDNNRTLGASNISNERHILIYRPLKA
jgi:predicted acyl esterase